MHKSFSLQQHTSVRIYIYDDQFDKREVLRDPHSIELTNLNTMGLLDFDLSGLKGMRLLGATLSMKVLTPDYPHEVAVTTINEQWEEQFATNYTARENTPWAGSRWLSDVIMHNGGSVYHRVKTVYDASESILHIEIAPDILYACANGISCGLGLIDTKSRSYAPLNGALWCGDQIPKKLGASAECGFAPVLDVIYEPASVQHLPAVKHFSSIGAEEPERFHETSVLLSWEKDFSAFTEGDTFYHLYMARLTDPFCEEMPLAEMTPVPRYMIPAFDPGRLTDGTKIEALLPETEYLFALTLSNTTSETAPVYTRCRTLSARKPLTVPQASPASEEASVLKAPGFQAGVACEIDKFDPVSGRNYFSDVPLRSSVDVMVSPGEKIGFQLIVENLTDAPKDFSITVTDNQLSSMQRDHAITFSRSWYLPIDGHYYADAQITLENSFSIPWAENQVSGQRSQAIFADLHVPEDTKPGLCSFAVQISDEESTVTVPFRLQVTDIRLQKTDFKVELNGYVSLPKCAGYEPGDPDFDEVEQEYYRLAHDNGMVNNILPYFHIGIVQDTFAPLIEIQNDIPVITDWEPWDKHFEPYLSGSFTADDHTGYHPVSHIYLPFHENWPMPIKDYYLVDMSDYSADDYPENINQHKLRAHSPAVDFRPAYREGIKKILKEFIRHIDEKGWQHVTFQYFLNNKHFYKRKGFLDACKDRRSLEFWLTEPTCGNDGSGTSWWLLDEPNFMDDWDAIRYYGSILREAQAETGSGKNIRFRADLSCYNLMFDSLDGILDIGVCGSTFYNHRADYLTERRARYGEDSWVYGSWNAINENNLQCTLWFLDSYLQGGQGIIPWYNFALDYNYEMADTCAGVYPGKRFGSKKPFPSLRLKAGRKAIELMNYLDTLKHTYGYSQLQIKSYVTDFLRSYGMELSGETIKENDVDAGTVKFRKIADYAVLEALKCDIIRRLSFAHRH